MSRSPESYAKAMHAVRVMMPDETLARIRALRLWHWKMVVCWRNIAESTTVVCKLSAAAKVAANKEANMHLGHVQALNDFFEIGDDAMYEVGANDGH